jgi:hypothetical protein
MTYLLSFDLVNGNRLLAAAGDKCRKPLAGRRDDAEVGVAGRRYGSAGGGYRAGVGASAASTADGKTAPMVRYACSGGTPAPSASLQADLKSASA